MGPRAGTDDLRGDGTFHLPEFEKRLLGLSNCRLVSTATDLPRILWLFVNCSGFLTLYVEVGVLDLSGYFSKLGMRYAADG